MVSCVKIIDKFEQVEFVNYKYPYGTENNDINCEIIVHLKEDGFKYNIDAQVPFLKYNIVGSFEILYFLASVDSSSTFTL